MSHYSVKSDDIYYVRDCFHRFCLSTNVVFSVTTLSTRCIYSATQCRFSIVIDSCSWLASTYRRLALFPFLFSFPEVDFEFTSSFIVMCHGCYSWNENSLASIRVSISPMAGHLYSRSVSICIIMSNANGSKWCLAVSRCRCSHALLTMTSAASGASLPANHPNSQLHQLDFNQNNDTGNRQR